MNKEIWEQLSAVDVTPFVENKNGLSYLSWANAWGLLMDIYPDASFEVLHRDERDDGTVTVKTSVTVQNGDKSVTRSMWLPVMDYKNKPVVNPNARDISDNTMRCLVKNIALFGLGLSLYRGEVAPEKHSPVVRNPASSSQMLEIDAASKNGLLPEPTVAWLNARDVVTSVQADKILEVAAKAYAAEAAKDNEETLL